MGTNYYAVPNRPSTREPIHIGKSSCGWMFLFHGHNERWYDPPVVWNTYEEVKEWLKKNVVESKEYVIMNEYDEIVPFESLFELIDRKQERDKDNPDNFKYVQNVNGYRFDYGDFS